MATKTLDTPTTPTTPTNSEAATGAASASETVARPDDKFIEIVADDLATLRAEFETLRADVTRLLERVLPNG